MLGTRDFVRKNGFTDVVIGLSGGIDSALVAAIAVEALGPEHVHGVLMPSRYSSDHSITDAEELADNLGIERRTVPIEPAHVALMGMLEPSFGERPPGLTEENLQSRIRAVILMGLSNAFGWLLLNTGNKSESSVGYSTLYGDSAGGYAVIKDVSKLRVYELCRHRNAAAGSGDHPGVGAAASRRRPSCGPTSATTRASRPTRCSTRSWRSTSRATSPPRTSSPAATTPPSSTASSGWSTWPSTSAASRRPARGSPRRASARTGASRS